jgi:hypothetical protein
MFNNSRGGIAIHVGQARASNVSRHAGSTIGAVRRQWAVISPVRDPITVNVEIAHIRRAVSIEIEIALVGHAVPVAVTATRVIHAVCDVALIGGAVRVAIRFALVRDAVGVAVGAERRQFAHIRCPIPITIRLTVVRYAVRIAILATWTKRRNLAFIWHGAAIAVPLFQTIALGTCQQQ